MNHDIQSHSIGVCSSECIFNNIIERMDYMTMIVCARNKNMIFVASDSWNHFKGNNNLNNHYIEKIVINDKYPMIIAQAGENSKQKK